MAFSNTSQTAVFLNGILLREPDDYVIDNFGLVKFTHEPQEGDYISYISYITYANGQMSRTDTEYHNEESKWKMF